MARTLVVGEGNPSGDSVLTKFLATETALINNFNPAKFDQNQLKRFIDEAGPSIGMGSGIGLELEEEPYFLKEGFQPEYGMVLNLRVAFEYEGKKVLRGDTILLSQGQPELLTQ